MYRVSGRRVEGLKVGVLGSTSDESDSPTQGPSWGYLKVIFSETLSFFGDKCPQNGSKNEPMAPRTNLECPHIGVCVDLAITTPTDDPK